jgi:hypothetical protein
VSLVTAGTVLVLSEVDPAPGPDDALPTRMCAAINVLAPHPPLLVVAHGDLALLLPAVALAQRSAHRRVRGYLLVEPELPPVTDGWPDAPVTIAASDAEGWLGVQARLRGWDLIAVSDVPEWLAAHDDDA